MKLSLIALLLISGMISIFSEVILLKNKDVIRGTIVESGETKMKVQTTYGEVTIDKDKIYKIYITEEDYLKENSTDNSDNKGSDDSSKSEYQIEKERKKRLETSLENNLHYYTQKKIIPIGIGFTVAGLSVNLVSSAIFIPLVIRLQNSTTISFLAAIESGGLFLQTVGIIALIKGCIAYSNYIKTKDTTFENKDTVENYKNTLNMGTGFLVPGILLTSIGLGAGIPIFIMPAFNPEMITDNPGLTTGISWMAAVLSLGVLFDIASIICYSVSGNVMKKWKSGNNISYDLGIKNDTIYSEICIKL
jgi:hypothetical protein